MTRSLKGTVRQDFRPMFGSKTNLSWAPEQQIQDFLYQSDQNYKSVEGLPNWTEIYCLAFNTFNVREKVKSCKGKDEK